jgi:hypothetical protein
MTAKDFEKLAGRMNLAEQIARNRVPYPAEKVLAAPLKVKIADSLAEGVSAQTQKHLGNARKIERGELIGIRQVSWTALI